MPRPIKKWKYKDTGSLAQYQEGEYMGAIPHELLNQLMNIRKSIGKVAFKVKLDLIKKEYDLASNGKRPVFDPER